MDDYNEVSESFAMSLSTPFKTFEELFESTEDMRLISAYIQISSTAGSKFVFTINDGKAHGPISGEFWVPFEIAITVAGKDSTKENILFVRDVVNEAETEGFSARNICDRYVQIFKLGDERAQMQLIDNVASKMACIQRLSHEMKCLEKGKPETRTDHAYYQQFRN